MEHLCDLYGPAVRHHAQLTQEDKGNSESLAQWKQNIAKAWPKVSLRQLSEAPTQIKTGETVPLRVAVQLNGLRAEDVIVECLMDAEGNIEHSRSCENHALLPVGTNDKGETLFSLDLQPGLPGLQYYKIRLYPYHRLLAHRFETGKCAGCNGKFY